MRMRKCDVRCTATLPWLHLLEAERPHHIMLNQSGFRSCLCKLLSDFLLAVVEKRKQWSKPMLVLAVTALLCDNPKPSGITDRSLREVTVKVRRVVQFLKEEHCGVRLVELFLRHVLYFEHI